MKIGFLPIGFPSLNKVFTYLLTIWPKYSVKDA